jgi:hypothetical protein
VCFALLDTGDLTETKFKLPATGRDDTVLFDNAQLFYSKLPTDIGSRFVVLVDPMLATGGSAAVALNVSGFHVTLCNTLVCPIYTQP